MPGTLADAQFSTKPYNSAFAAARQNGARLNKADHSARAKARLLAQKWGDEITPQECTKCPPAMK
jgi:hypothetical protein